MARASTVLFASLLLMVMAGTECTETNLVPEFPPGVTLENHSQYNLWMHALRKQNSQTPRSDVTSPLTLLDLDYGLMMNLVPQDSPHPLYADAALRAEFLKDYMLDEAVNADDPRMTQPDGLTVKNLNGKDIIFKKNADGKITANDIEVVKVEDLGDGLNSYIISRFLFDHRQRVQDALEKLRRESPSRPFGRPSPGIVPPQ